MKVNLGLDDLLGGEWFEWADGDPTGSRLIRFERDVGSVLVEVAYGLRDDDGGQRSGFIVPAETWHAFVKDFELKGNAKLVVDDDKQQLVLAMISDGELMFQLSGRPRVGWPERPRFEMSGYWAITPRGTRLIEPPTRGPFNGQD